MGEEVVNGFREGSRVSDGDEFGGVGWGEEIGDTANTGGNYGSLGKDGFHDNARHAFVLGAKDK